jgi:predicted permease
MPNLQQDLRFGIRQMLKAPGFAVATILTIALGIGATTSIFSLVNAVLLRPLPFVDPDRLVVTGPVNDRRPEPATSVNSSSYPDFFDWRAQNHSFSTLAECRDNTFTLTGAGAGEPKHLDGQVVSADFFKVLGVEPAMGRGIVMDDEKIGTHVVVLSHELWRSVFSADPAIVGRGITIDDKSYTVIGVMPQGFEFPIQTPTPQLWTSLADDAYDPTGDKPVTAQRGAHMLGLVGRLKPGVSLDQATADLSVIARNLAAQYQDSNKHYASAKIVTLLDYTVGDTRSALRMLFAAVVLMLLVACANVAGLLLARASRRRPEIAVRSAMGASRAQIVRQFLAESVLLSMIGGVLGIFIAVLLLHGVLQLLPSDLPRATSITIDSTVLAFSLAVSLVTGLLFGVLPALRTARVDPSVALRDGTRTATTGRGQHRLHNSLVIAQTTVGLVLLIGAGLLIRSFVRVLQVDPGFDRRNVLTASLSLPDNRYPRDKQIEFYQDLLPRLRSMPGVVSASAGWPLPLSPSGIGITFDIEERPQPESERNVSRVSIVEPGYFQTLRIPLVRGREFQDTDTTQSKAVVVVNQAFAQKFFPGEDAIGKRINPGLDDGVVTDVQHEIVGIVGDVKVGQLTRDIVPEMYLPFNQSVILSPKLVIRSATEPVSLISALRAQVAQVDKNLPLYEVRTMDEVFSRSAAQQRFQALLVSAFAVISLMLSAIGLYGLLSYLVAQRTLEIGVRMALGAPRQSVLIMVLRRGMVLAAIGVALGVAVSLALTNFLKGMLFGIRPLDALTFVVVSAVLLLVCFLASSGPAYRAARLDPVKTLRDQ